MNRCGEWCRIRGGRGCVHGGFKPVVVGSVEYVEPFCSEFQCNALCHLYFTRHPQIQSVVGLPMGTVARNHWCQVAIASGALTADAAESVVSGAVLRKERNRPNADERRNRPPGFRRLTATQAEAAQHAPTRLPYDARHHAHALTERANASIRTVLNLVRRSPAIECSLRCRPASVVTAHGVFRLRQRECTVNLQTIGVAAPNIH